VCKPWLVLLEQPIASSVLHDSRLSVYRTRHKAHSKTNYPESPGCMSALSQRATRMPGAKAKQIAHQLATASRDPSGEVAL